MIAHTIIATTPSLPQLPLPCVLHVRLCCAINTIHDSLSPPIPCVMHVCTRVHACLHAQGPRRARSQRVAQRAALGSSGWLRCARSSGVIRVAALCAVARGHQEGCAARGLPGSSAELRCARLRGLAWCAGPREGFWKVPRLRRARPRGRRNGSKLPWGSLGSYWL